MAPPARRQRRAASGPPPASEPASVAPSASDSAGAAATSSVASLLAQALGSPATSPKEEAAPLAERFGKLFGSGPPPTVPIFRRPTSASAASATSKAVQSAEATKTGQGLGSSAPSTERKRKAPPTEEELDQKEACTLFLGNVPLEWSKADLRRSLRAALGEVYTGSMRPIRFRSEPLEDQYSGKMRKVGSVLQAYSGTSDAKNAYIVLDSPKAVEAVCRVMNGFDADGRHVLRADGVGEYAKLLKFDRKRSVFIGNLPPSTSEADLRAAMASAGTVDAVRVVRDRKTQACRGVAFVRFRIRGSVKAALELSGLEIKGRPIRVTRVKKEEDEEEDEEDELVDEGHPAALRLQKKAAKKIKRWIQDESNGGTAPSNKSATTGKSASRKTADQKGKGKGKSPAKGPGKGPGKFSGKGPGKGSGKGSKKGTGKGNNRVRS